MGQRRAYLHVGLDDGSGDVVAEALGRHEHALLDLRVRRPHDPAGTFRAVVDVLGTHDDWDLARDEVDGAWADLVERAHKGRDTIVLSEPLLAAAPAERARAVVSSLDGFDVHAVMTARAPEPWAAACGRDLAEVLPRWADAVGAAERVHVLVGDDPVTTWKALGRVAGFGTASLRVKAPTAHGCPTVDPELAAAWREALGRSPYDVVGDLDLLTAPVEDGEGGDGDRLAAAHAALASAHRELTLLRARNADLTARLDKAERKKAKLKRRLSKLG